MATRRWRRQWEAQGLVEYSLILLLMALAAFVALSAVGPGVAGLYDMAKAAFPQ